MRVAVSLPVPWLLPHHSGVHSGRLVLIPSPALVRLHVLSIHKISAIIAFVLNQIFLILIAFIKRLTTHMMSNWYFFDNRLLLFKEF
jgi:hypothetical protein